MSSNIVSLSGGKDSTALLLMMLERGEDVAEILFFDTGWEFPQMYDHLEQLKKFIGRDIKILKPHMPFNYYLTEYPFNYRATGEPTCGYGWPQHNRRWCTRRKADALYRQHNAMTDYLSLPVRPCVGYAADEQHRADNFKSTNKNIIPRFPLIEWGITEQQALEYCRKRGFTWGGLYDICDRVSCFCCPLGGIKNARRIWQHFPELWRQMIEMESLMKEEVKKRFTPRFKKIKKGSYIDVDDGEERSFYKTICTNEGTLTELQARFEAEANMPLFNSGQVMPVQTTFLQGGG